MKRFYEILDLSHARKVFVVGDIHGMFTMLEERLAELGFDTETDYLLSVGDLVDRGPESDRAVEFAEKPWFKFVRGNHEQILQSAAMGMNRKMHEHNGGLWFKTLDQTEQDLFSEVLNDAPVVLEVILPSGRRIGIIHADIPSGNWDDVRNLEPAYRNTWTEYCLWNRTRVMETKSLIRNIDHVYFGHTPLADVYTIDNCTWIDTGACRQGGKLTVLEV